MTRTEFISTVLMLGFKLRKSYKNTYDLKNTVVYISSTTNFVLIYMNTRYEYSDYTIALKKILELYDKN